MFYTHDKNPYICICVYMNIYCKCYRNLEEDMEGNLVVRLV